MSARSLSTAGLLAGAVVLAHLLVLGGEFVYDDIPIVEQNPRIRSFDRIPEIFTTTYWGDEIHAGLYRPLTLTSFVIDYQIWGPRAWGFRLVNLLIHVANVLLVLALLRRIGLPAAAASLGALLFGIHPVHAEVVTSVVGRTDLLGTLFVIAALMIFIRYREENRGLLLIGIGACFLIGILAKEVTACLPLLMLGWDFLGRPGGDRPGLKPRWLAPYLVIGVLLALYLPLRLTVIGALGPLEENTVFFGDPWQARWGTMLGVLYDYLRMFLFPANLAADFPYHPGRVPGFDLRALAGAAVLIALIACALLRRGAIGFSIAVFLFALAPVSNIVISTGIVKAARLLYLPSLGLCAIAGVILMRAWSRPAGRAAAVGVLLSLGAINMKTTTYWLDNEVLWRRTLEIAPDSSRGLYNLGALLAQRGEGAEAERLWLEAREINPADSGLPVAFGRLYLQEGRNLEAERSFVEALSMDPPPTRALDAMLGLAEVFSTSGRHGDAEQQLGVALELRPDSKDAHFALGIVFAQQGKWEEAEQSFRRVLEIDPGAAGARVQIGHSLYRRGRPAEALVEYRDATQGLEGRDLADLFVKMGDCRMAVGEEEGAIDLYQRALALAPDHPGAQAGLSRAQRTRATP